MQLNKTDSLLYAVLVSILLKGEFYKIKNFLIIKKYLNGCKMANIIKCFNLVLGYKGNVYKGYKQTLVFLKFKKLIKELVKK